MSRFIILIVALASCAKHVPPPETAKTPPKPEESEAPPPQSAPKPDHDDGMVVTGTLGTLGDEDIASTFRGRWSDVTRCLQTPPHLAYLIGRVELKLRVGSTGEPTVAHVQDSSLGHYGAEHCLLELARTLKFPSPRGGNEAEFSYPIEYKPVRTAAAVYEWSKDRVAPEKLGPDLHAIQQCRGSIDGTPIPPPPPPGRHKHKSSHHAAAAPKLGPMRPLPKNLRLTMYIGPGGKVVTAGLAADEPVDPNMATCLVSSASLWRLDDPGGRPAKLTVEVAP
jgi:hypothetical protein